MLLSFSSLYLILYLQAPARAEYIRKENWYGKRPVGERDTQLFDTQKQAQDYAIKIAKNQKSEVIVQGKDGKIRSKDSYGNDPCPPRDTEH